ncbi:hypothetical protein [Ruminococcus sp.]|uniref:hypothetical protein n=1 Tax=Ruminococcus sp. TaxID=41978 RepID=UPI0025F6FE95|nr:hypothetical protein [Ruminococcus sp.]
MSRLIKQHYKKIIVLVLFFLIFLGVFVYRVNKYFKPIIELHEKTTFTAQETNILWSELGLEYIDLDISKAYFNRNNRLYVVSEGFDSIESEIEYLKQFEGNEKVEEGAALEHNHKGDAVSELFDIKCTDKGYFRDCFTYEENGKYYLEFYKIDAGRNKDYNLYEMFGLKTNNSDG